MTAAVRSAVLSLALELISPRSRPTAVIAEVRVRPLDWEGARALASAARVMSSVVPMAPSPIVAAGEREGTVRVRLGIPDSSPLKDGCPSQPVPTASDLEAQLLVALEAARPVLRARGYRVSIRGAAPAPRRGSLNGEEVSDV